VIIVFGSINLDLVFALPSIPVAGETVLGASVRIEPGERAPTKRLRRRGMAPWC